MTLEETVKELKKKGLSGKEIYDTLIGPASSQVLGGLGVSEERIEELIEDSSDYNEATSDSTDIYRWVLGECGDSHVEFYKAEGVEIESEKYCNDCSSRNDREVFCNKQSKDKKKNKFLL